MIEEAIFARLSGWAGLAGLVGTSIYPMRAPQNVPAPYVVYQRISAPRLRSLLGGSGQANPRIQIDAYGTSYAQSKAVAEQVRLALDNFRGTVRLPDGTSVKIGACSLETDRDLIDGNMDPELFRTLHEFSLWHDE